MVDCSKTLFFLNNNILPPEKARSVKNLQKPKRRFEIVKLCGTVLEKVCLGGSERITDFKFCLIILQSKKDIL